MTYTVPFKVLPAVALVMLTACNSSSESDSPLASQAIDGYIVGAEVFCDGVLSGMTRAAGRFTCPAGTQLSKISGGYDVGIDAVATNGTVAFGGVLTAPASEPYVTPMTTLSVAIAQLGQSEGAAFDLSSFNDAQQALATTLGISSLSLKANPVENLSAAKSNAKIHQVLSAFTPNLEGYEEATSALASVISDNADIGGSISLTSDVSEVMSSINRKLMQSSSPLAKATIDLDQAAINVVAANASIDLAESPARVASESTKALVNLAPVTIDRKDASVTLLNLYNYEMLRLDIDDFESTQQTDGLYAARLYPGITQIRYDSDVFQFNQNINDARVTVAFEIKSVNASDRRSMSFVSNDVVISAIKDRPDSLVITRYSDDAIFSVVGQDSNGVITNATIEFDENTFTSRGDRLEVNLEKINSRLRSLELDDILSTSGDYSMTLVLSGLRVNERDRNITSDSREYTVGEGVRAVSGNGFRGYVSILR